MAVKNYLIIRQKKTTASLYQYTFPLHHNYLVLRNIYKVI